MNSLAHRLAAATAFSALALSCAGNAQTGSLFLVNRQDVPDAYLDVAPASSWSLPSGFTFEAWVTYDDATTPTTAGFRWPTLARLDPTPGQESLMIRVDAANAGNRNLKIKVRTTTGSYNASWTFNPGALANWSHLAGTYDGQTLRLFVDAVQVASVPATGALAVNAGAVLRLGNGDVSSSGAENWNGGIDEVRIWPWARSAAEIAATRNLEITALPSGCSTWNLNGNAQDSSAANHGVPSGIVSYVASGPTLNPVPSGAVVGGPASGTCSGRMSDLGVRAVPRLGTAAFGLAATAARPGSTSGVVMIASRALGQPLPVLGVNLYVDLLDPSYFSLTVPSYDAFGTASVTLPIPNDPRLVLASAVAQVLFLDTTCGGPLFASNSLGLVVVP